MIASRVRVTFPSMTISIAIRSGLVFVLLTAMASCDDAGSSEGGDAGAGGAAGWGGNAGGFAGTSGGNGGGVGGAAGSAGAGMGGGGEGASGTGGSGAVGGEPVGGTGGDAGTAGSTPDPCEDARAPEDRCPVCADETGCDGTTYTDNGDGTVNSSCCGLVWQREVDDGEYDWEASKVYCEQLSIAGGGWRLPTKDELLSLLVPGASPPIDTSAFGDTPEQYYWSVTPHRTSSRSAWQVSFFAEGGGFASTGSLGLTSKVRCVR